MKKKVFNKFITILFLLSAHYSFTQNLIQNPSFEQGTQPWGYGWYDQCGPIIFTQPDTICMVTYSNDVPSGGGNFSARIDAMGNILPISWARTNIFPSTGSNIIIDVNGWAKKQFLSGSGAITLEKRTGNQYTFLKSVQIIDTVWTLYSFSDTFNIGLTDTIVVSITATAGGPNSEHVFADLMYAQASNIASAISSGNRQEEINFFPNPTKGKVTLILNNFNEDNIQTEILNAFGQLIFSEKIKLLNGSVHKEYDLIKSGVYQINIITPSSIYHKTIVIE